ncbi:transketolase family protein [Aureibacillus halotolerans]|uniref:Transketolase n=1 Tax=Aureibacillus halotolerans TaxID=1508390 RepID=A0A4R6TPG9_9BACI|nr:transketolase C-terminal domain-containing protein [Aureibacillus halotolerans]TDQ33766.1 transketolase [Aureibacillus halotolerans]
MKEALMRSVGKNTIANRKAMSEMLLELARLDKDLVVLTSDSRGSASLNEFAKELPQQLIEVGIAEQNIVGIAAGLASAGKKPFVASPACFLSMRAIEQIKVDVAYSQMNVKLIGISGGISYGALGMSHHSVQDLAVTRAIPGLDVFMPADRHETKKMIATVYETTRPAYIRIGRNAVEDVYASPAYTFEPGKAIMMKEGMDLTIIASGETVRVAMDTAMELSARHIDCRVLNMHTIKPLDEKAVLKAAAETGCLMTIEEHSIFGGLGAAVAELVSQVTPVPMKIVGIPDEPAIAGTTAEVFAHYGITPLQLVNDAAELVARK